MKTPSKLLIIMRYTSKKFFFNHCRQLVMLMVLLGLFSCGQDPIPKPIGYYRIALPPDTFKVWDGQCAYTFDVHAYSIAKEKREKCWIDIHYPHLKAMIQLTYKPVNNNIDTLLNDMHNLVFRHTVKADGISEKQFFNDEANAYGTLYKLHGSSATHTQFFITDSVNHFLRGVVYFNAVPNEDSLKPVNEYMYQQVSRLMESLEWQ
ncbi:MAG: gliding motility lipoprotein GldD [Cryomorphaceae bacterium]|nr:gliding motility lipoprotein GldD [Cryomorphaceae bacterium]